MSLNSVLYHHRRVSSPIQIPMGEILTGFVNIQVMIIDMVKEHTKKPGYLIGLLLFDCFIIQCLEEDIQHQDVIPVEKRKTSFKKMFT